MKTYQEKINNLYQQAVKDIHKVCKCPPDKKIWNGENGAYKVLFYPEMADWKEDDNGEPPSSRPINESPEVYIEDSCSDNMGCYVYGSEYNGSSVNLLFVSDLGFKEEAKLDSLDTWAICAIADFLNSRVNNN